MHLNTTFPSPRFLDRRGAWAGITLMLISAFETGPTIALAGGLAVAEDADPAVAEFVGPGVLTQLNEVSKRRRLTTFFVNEQSAFYGVQINYVNVSRGNLTFLNRDLVRYDRIPIVFGRVYDSSSVGGGDFGRGWKLSVAEVIRSKGRSLRYTDASGSEYELDRNGTRISSRYPHLTGIERGRFRDGGIELRVGEFVKRFGQMDGDYYLEEVRDQLGDTLHIEYKGTRVERISTSGGRFVDIRRDSTGRITGARDDSGRRVTYSYDGQGQLEKFADLGEGHWAMSYDAAGRLAGVIDPRKVAKLTASYDERGRADRVAVLSDVMTFSYGSSQTLVETALNQSATFWHDVSGLTRSIQDFAGDVTEITFDDSLHATELSFNGRTMAELRYAQRGQLRGIRSFVSGDPSTSMFDYDADGRVPSVSTDGQLVAQYEYDALGNVLSVLDWDGYRAYQYDPQSQVRKITFNATEIRVDINDIGLLTGFAGEDFRVRIAYDDHDLVRGLRYRLKDRQFESRYEYGRLGLRTGASYVAEEAPDESVELAYLYDEVGNLTGLEQEGPSGASGSQTYVLGEKNELTRLITSRGPSLEYEYDASGRARRATLEDQEALFEYDALGRLSDVYFNREHMLTSDYGPMDVDAATEADGHSPLTTVASPIASAIFGTLEKIAYARTSGSPFGPIRFNASMARYVLAESLVPAPDAVVLTSFNRRALPLFGADPQGYGPANINANVNPGPLGYHKPSNGLFLPAEFSSLNCYVCVSYSTPYPYLIASASFVDINGNGSVAQVDVGQVFGHVMN